MATTDRKDTTPRKVRVALIEVMADQAFLTEDDSTAAEGWHYLADELKRYMHGFGRAASVPIQVKAYFESWDGEAVTL